MKTFIRQITSYVHDYFEIYKYIFYRTFFLGIPCTNCGSRLTFSHNLTNYDISKNETWGSKDVNNMTARVECRECRNIWTILSES